VAGHVDFGDDVDVACGGVGNDVADLFLGVEAAVAFAVVGVAVSVGRGGFAPGADFGEFGVFLDFDAPALVFC
jgi:hypothetical protein